LSRLELTIFVAAPIERCFDRGRRGCPPYVGAHMASTPGTRERVVGGKSSGLLELPLGLLGTIAERTFLDRYLRRFLETRLRMLKEMAERNPQTRSLDPIRG
jgi:hypothetical protein